MAKQRADKLLVERGLVETRAKAQALIMAGKVFSADRRIAKAGDLVAEDAPLEVKGQDHPWVSRGGLKLAHALAHFALDPEGGGRDRCRRFDRRLHRRAADQRRREGLCRRCRPRPAGLEAAQRSARRGAGTHQRAPPHRRSEIPEPVDWVVCDASFIGLETVLPAALSLTKPSAIAVALIKPQFEVGPDRVGKGGVVRDPALHQEVCDRIRAWFGRQPGWSVLGIVESPVLGPEGNKEFLIAARKDAP